MIKESLVNLEIFNEFPVSFYTGMFLNMIDCMMGAGRISDNARITGIFNLAAHAGKRMQKV